MKHCNWMAAGPLLVACALGSIGCGSSDASPPGGGHFAAGDAANGSSSFAGSIGNSQSPSLGLSPGTGGSSSGVSPTPGAPSPVVGAPSASGGASSSVADEPVAPGPQPELLPSNPFVIAAHDPLSTFAADVDTASYDIFMSSVAKGLLPPAQTVRLEEFVNYFHYGYAPPTESSEHPFSISLAAAPALDLSSLMLRVGIRGRLPAQEKRPANLVFLVDTSGSMAAANKLPLVQFTLSEALAVLDPSDSISIVSYAGSTAVRLQPTPVAEAATIEAAIAGLSAAGGTNGGSGIMLAYEQAKAGFIDGGINHVLLCTDGDFNVGITSDDALVQLITEERQSGVTFTALGYGSNPNDAMMERVSNAGNGTYSVIYNQSQAREYVEVRLLSNLDYIAKDMKIQVEFNPEKVYAYRLLGYEDRDIADNDFRNDVVDAGEVGAGHRVTALYQLVLVGGELPSSSVDVPVQDGAAYAGPSEVAAADYALVKIRYKQPAATEQDPASEVSAVLGDDGIAEAWSKLDGDFQWAYAVASFAEILKSSPYAMPGALNTIDNIISQSLHDGSAEREDFRAAFARARPLLAP